MIIVTDNNGEAHEFYGDELTSEESQAILFLQQQIKDKEGF